MLSIHHITKRFGTLVAVDDLSLEVREGETVVMMGPSGCGKSTTVRAVNRLVEPDAGSILFQGSDILKMTEPQLWQARKKIGFVFQHFNLIQRLTAAENVMLGLVMDGMPRETAYDKALDALDKVGLRELSERKPSELSGGQQQRVGIARAIAAEPPLMLWDEPTASLDPMIVREVLVVMEELARYHKSAMLVVTHELPFALHAADRIILMDQGRIVETGPPDQVFISPQSDVGGKYKELIEYQNTTTVGRLRQV
ncbi:amino acid ABC transporter ATP-binding protein [Acetonema longum]|uniref:Amino acid ABC transporter ATP-binding protein, PAAT family n=1 Tax=Acetonema longum DSM 6540 TaxID=1009370 RepID=F7NM14_9FIRM|nr:amino acid ABC transporter ATP-binding protein [Acetonema longum]EGO62940.1 amino acid ABC transporter ATP-binding protein, PAAT family [Acetonema longum DSM 6540]